MAHTMLKLDVERVGILAILSSYLLDACLFGIYFELNCNPAYFSAQPSQAQACELKKPDVVPVVYEPNSKSLDLRSF